jgi:16S rRNA (guanine527-N7)-methyltransferase
VHVEQSLAAADVVRLFPGPIVDVGAGGGAPGIPLAVALPDREVTLLEASGRKCAFLREAARAFPNVRVVHGRAEEQGTDEYAVAVAKALAVPPVAAEWCLPLVAPGGAVVLYVGPSADSEEVSRVAARLGGGPAEELPGLLVLRKLEPTPAGFPRRPGVAKKRPLR